LLDHHPGGAALFRLSRSTPIRTMLHHSCIALGARLESELATFWQSVAFADLPCDAVIERFAFFLKRRVENGTVRLHFLPELLDFELASSELRFLPRRELLADACGSVPLTRDAGLALHPLVRISRFLCDAGALFTALQNGVECAVPPRESFLLLTVLREATPEVFQLDAALGRKLWALQCVGTFGGTDAELRALGDLNILVRSH
jgi:hypothetical protein